MERIAIDDLPVLEELSQEEMADIFGGQGSSGADGAGEAADPGPAAAPPSPFKFDVIGVSENSRG